MPSTSEVAAYHARDTTATPAEGCVRCCTSPCASLCALLCCVPRLSSLQHCSIPKDRPPQSYKDCIQQLPAMDVSEAGGLHICSQIREMWCITMWSHDSHVTNSGACVGHWYTLRCRLICTGTCTCMASLLVCLLFLLSALLTRVVCAHALLVSTSVSPPRCVHVRAWEVNGVPSFNKASLTCLFLQGGRQFKGVIGLRLDSYCLPHAHSSA